MTSGLLLRLVFIAGLMTGCQSEPAPTGVYAKYLKPGEEVTKAVVQERFVMLSIFYHTGSGYFTSTQQRYMRLIHRDKIVVKKSRLIEPWQGLGRPVYFAEIDDDLPTSNYLIYEAAAKPIVKRIDAGDPTSDYTTRIATEQYYFGFPMQTGLRYFPGRLAPGFLLSVFPISVKILPNTYKDHRSYFVPVLASISPDGKSYVYVDSADAPSIVMVVDDVGEVRAVGPRSVVHLPPEPAPEINPYERLWSWFSATYAWRRNSVGQWNVVVR